MISVMGCVKKNKIQRSLTYGCMPLICGKCHLSEASPGYLSLPFWKVNPSVPEKVRNIECCGVIAGLPLAE